MSPKKSGSAGKNAFFYFMMDLMQQQGRKIKSMRDASEIAGPMWNKMSQKEREPYENMARRGKLNQNATKLTTYGTSIAHIEKEEKDLKQQELVIRQNTQKTVQMLMQTNKVSTHLFYIIHINNFCYSNVHKRNYPAEIAVARFCLSEGIDSDNVFHRVIHPGPLPLGYSFAARSVSEETHQLPVPAGVEAPDNTEEVFNDLVTFLTELQKSNEELPPLYAREKEIPFILETLKTFANDFAQDVNMFKIYSLEFFLFVLKNAVAEDQVWPAISLSADEIERDVYDFTSDIACEYHQSVDSPVFCSKAIVTRLGYIVCDNCCKYLEIDLVPGRHVPSKAKVQAAPRSNTASYASSAVDDQESACGYQLAPSAESDRCSSALSFVSVDTALDDDDFPALGSSRRTNTDSDSVDWRSARSSMGTWGRGRPIELPSALSNRMEEMSIQPKPKGRGRGIIKRANMQ